LKHDDCTFISKVLTKKVKNFECILEDLERKIRVLVEERKERKRRRKWEKRKCRLARARAE
jgi:hypothetical protein